MKRIIEGKVYDTETAEKLADFWNGLSTSDFDRVCEALYKTKSGAFFLSGEGGPLTKYARPVGDMTGGGKGVFPLSREEALAWCEEHGETGVIEKHFADMITPA